MHIFLINAPAGAGKDTLGQHLEMLFDYGEVVKFARPIKDAACAIYCNNDDDEFNYFDSQEMKNIPHAKFMGKSCREVQIGLSEVFMKPFHNSKAPFGKILANYIDEDSNEEWLVNNNPIYFVTDSGFREEAMVLIDKFGKDNVSLIQIHRPGYSFDGDSRSYIQLDIDSHTLHNDSDEKTFLARGHELIKTILHNKQKA